MKALIGVAAAVAGYLYLRRTRPGALQKLEGQAKTIVGGLSRCVAAWPWYSATSVTWASGGRFNFTTGSG